MVAIRAILLSVFGVASSHIFSIRARGTEKGQFFRSCRHTARHTEIPMKIQNPTNMLASTVMVIGSSIGCSSNLSGQPANQYPYANPEGDEHRYPKNDGDCFSHFSVSPSV
jgi:hypothetical protein